MMFGQPAQQLRARAAHGPLLRPSGQVVKVVGFEVQVAGLKLRVGDGLLVAGRSAEVVAASAEVSVALVAGSTVGIGAGDPVVATGHQAACPVGHHLLGRVVDGNGTLIDAGPAAPAAPTVALERPPPPALDRPAIDTVLPTGVAALDVFTTVGSGQRIGLFAGSGVGKSTLLAMLARGAAADVIVVALVGERGREVSEFLTAELPERFRSRTVAVVATSDEPPLLKRRAALYAHTLAEWFADQGSNVLLLFDSLTRLAAAQRDIGLAAGEPPTVRGYTPSVFTLLPQLLERAGTRPSKAAVTAIYTILVDGDDQVADPIADTTRGILDGHVLLDRAIAVRGRYPAIDVPRSLSRLAAKLLPADRHAQASKARAAWAAAGQVQDLVEVGAYVQGTNPSADRGLALEPHLEQLCAQLPADQTGFEQAWSELDAVLAREDANG